MILVDQLVKLDKKVRFRERIPLIGRWWAKSLRDKAYDISEYLTAEEHHEFHKRIFPELPCVELVSKDDLEEFDTLSFASLRPTDPPKVPPAPKLAKRSFNE